MGARSTRTIVLAFNPVLEGLSFCDDCLWLTGSHSALRDGTEGHTVRDAIAALAKVRRAARRDAVHAP